MSEVEECCGHLIREHDGFVGSCSRCECAGVAPLIVRADEQETT